MLKAGFAVEMSDIDLDPAMDLLTVGGKVI